jgi:hypothetical protein
VGVFQPVTTIDTWWEWCNPRSTLPPKKAADFHIARFEDIRRTCPGKEVILTEFGWPNAPEGDVGKYWGICQGEPPYTRMKF